MLIKIYSTLALKLELPVKMCIIEKWISPALKKPITWNNKEKKSILDELDLCLAYCTEVDDLINGDSLEKLGLYPNRKILSSTTKFAALYNLFYQNQKRYDNMVIVQGEYAKDCISAKSDHLLVGLGLSLISIKEYERMFGLIRGHWQVLPDDLDVVLGWYRLPACATLFPAVKYTIDASIARENISKLIEKQQAVATEQQAVTRGNKAKHIFVIAMHDWVGKHYIKNQHQFSNCMFNAHLFKTYGEAELAISEIICGENGLAGTPCMQIEKFFVSDSTYSELMNKQAISTSSDQK